MTYQFGKNLFHNKFCLGRKQRWTGSEVSIPVQEKEVAEEEDEEDGDDDYDDDKSIQVLQPQLSFSLGLGFDKERLVG